jgi:hypothetical protein
MAAASKKKKEKKKLTLGRLALVAGTKQTLSNLFWRLSISMHKTLDRITKSAFMAPNLLVKTIRPREIFTKTMSG